MEGCEVRGAAGIAFLTIVLLPAVASAQSVLLHASAGPTLVDAGYSLSAGGGIEAGSRVTVMFGLERTRLSSRRRTDGRGGTSVFRGGTLTTGTAELRVGLLRRDRIGPYALAGFGAGISRPHVTDLFPDRVTNTVRVVFFGGGVHVPLREQLALFADLRMMVGSEDSELLAVAPVRAGLSWRF
jgi:hypothetical protein